MTDPVILKLQRDSLRDALQKVLDTRAKEAAAHMSYENVLANFGPDLGKPPEGESAHARNGGRKTLHTYVAGSNDDAQEQQP